ncbi:MAG: hypothetical protein M3261_03595 [Thermoproteota archaeon]|nr:hypothetical protein [Thermoproteota archaeon]
MPSTAEGMSKDWEDACAFACLKIIEGEIDFTQIEPASYPLLEDTWLRDVKRLKAYYIWKSEDTGDSEKNYFKASNEIRRLLLWQERAPIQEFKKVKDYLEEHYLTEVDDEKLDENKPATNMLISRKARRIWEIRGDLDQIANWFRAKLYTTMFYENIIGAVVNDDKQKTLAILRAFEFSKSPANRYLIINGFETAIAISFLNKDIIHEVLGKPELYDFNMEPLDDWPDTVKFSNLRYDKDDKQLIYDGVMKEEERDSLLNVLPEKKHRQAVENLYQQSQFRPFKDMIL